MPWKETAPLEQRVQFVTEWKRGEASMAALCRSFGISRPTGYKWIERYFEDGDEGDVRALEDRPRRPISRPQTIDADRTDALVRARKLHPHWGPRKLRVWLSNEWPRVDWPAPSTIGEILKRHGLVIPRRRRRRTPPSTQPFADCAEPNAVWCVDFKGQFRLRNRQICYPLTMSDAFSRFLLRCEGVRAPDTVRVRPIFESAFREFGLPKAIRSDNGAPFASTAVGGLSPLSVWWIKLGIVPERIDPGKPQQNGRHERMHRTLKQETASPPKETFRAQQRAFDLFRRSYNEQRPHEALGQVPPATRYHRSARHYAGRPPERRPCYDAEEAIVDRQGEIRFGRRRYALASCLWGETVELTPAGERQWEVSFGPVLLGILDETRPQRDLVRPKRRRRSQRSMQGETIEP